MKILQWLLLFLTVCGGQAFKILAVFPSPFHSHYTIASTILKELANRGHEVTLIAPFTQKTPIKNLEEISVESQIGTMSERKKLLFTLNDKSLFESVHFLSNMSYIITKKVLQDKNMQQVLHSGKQYDLIILPQFMNEALLGVAHYFKAPHVLISSMPLFSWSSFILQHPSPSSYVPNLLTQYTGRMSFLQRLLNSFYDSYSILYYQWIILPKHQQLVKTYIPGSPNLYDFLNNASLLLSNSHVSTYEAIPQVPNVVEIGGVHLTTPKNLSLDLQHFLDESKNGVVVFSMGSNLKTSDFPQDKIQAVLAAFSKLDQNVLWKWESEELPNLPENVKIIKWLPQADILAHPNVKVFITHGGLLSTMESLYNGVPTIGIPIFADQKMNMAAAVSRGYAIVVQFQDLTEEKLSWALNEMLNDPKYKENAMKRSKIMRDQPIRPLDSAVYWIEYVVRNEGAYHLRYPGTDLNWFQRNLLDVVGFVLIAFIFVVGFVVYVTQNVLRRVCRRHTVHAKKE